MHVKPPFSGLRGRHTITPYIKDTDSTAHDPSRHKRSPAFRFACMHSLSVICTMAETPEKNRCTFNQHIFASH